MKFIFNEHSNNCNGCCNKDIFVFFNTNTFDWIVYNNCFTELNYRYFVDAMIKVKGLKCTYGIFNSGNKVERDLKRFRLEGQEICSTYPLVLCRALAGNHKYLYIIKEIPYLNIIDIQYDLEKSYTETYNEINELKKFNNKKALDTLNSIYNNNRQYISRFNLIKTQEHLVSVIKRQIRQNKKSLL